VQSVRRNIENCYIINAIADELAHDLNKNYSSVAPPKKSGAYGLAADGAFGAKESTKLRISSANRNPD
jgi:hypothetical protein